MTSPLIEREILFRVLQGPQDWMLRQIARKLLMLSTAAVNVTTVAYTVGYESPSQFGREYLRMFGRSPGEYHAKRH